MASALYTQAKQDLLGGVLDLDTDTVLVAMLSDAHTFDAGDTRLADVTAEVVGTAGTLLSKTVTNGVFDAADITLTNSSSGTTVEALVVYDTTVSNRLIAYIDNFTSFATAGNDVDVTFNASGIFSL